MGSFSRGPAALLASLVLLTAVPAISADAPPSTNDPADEVAASLFTALKAENYAAAYAMFDQRMQAGLSQARLKAIWSEQLGAFGPLVSWTITERTPRLSRRPYVGSMGFGREGSLGTAESSAAGAHRRVARK